jgi:hypothetical protein
MQDQETAWGGGLSKGGCSHSRHAASDFIESLYSTGLAWIEFAPVLEGVFIEGIEGEAVADINVELHGQEIKVILGKSSLEGGSGGIATLGFFDHANGRGHSLTLVRVFHAVPLFQGDGAFHGIQIRTGHGALENRGRLHGCIVWSGRMKWGCWITRCVLFYGFDLLLEGQKMRCFVGKF